MRTIKINKFLNSSITSRALARDLDLLVRNSGEKEVVFDFSGVAFTNRSFMDEFNVIFCNNKYPAKIEIVGMNSDLRLMLDAVKKTRNKTKPLVKKVEPVLLGDYQQVSNYFKTLPV